MDEFTIITTIIGGLGLLVTLGVLLTAFKYRGL